MSLHVKCLPPQMRHRLATAAVSPWRSRTLGGIRHRHHELLEKQLNLKQAHELPQSHEYPRRFAKRPWREELSWMEVAAFGSLGVACIGALIYEYQRYQKVRPSARRILDVSTFLPFTLIGKEPVTSNSSIFTLLPSQQSTSVGDPYERLWISPVWSVEAKQPQLQIARSYTPLPPSKPYDVNDPAATALRFIIREEDKGEMSGYLHRLGIGSVVELRGPKLECQIPSGLDEVVFFAGGTGIAPALQVAHHLSQLRPSGSGKLPRMHIVWSCRRREECRGSTDDTPNIHKSTGGSWSSMFGGLKAATQPAQSIHQQSPIVRELERLKAAYPGRLKIDYFVDEESSFVDQTVIQQFLTTRPADGEEQAKKAVIVSGPEGYISHLAGAKEWRDGKEQQGPLGGLLRGKVSSNWTVIKL